MPNVNAVCVQFWFLQGGAYAPDENPLNISADEVAVLDEQPQGESEPGNLMAVERAE